MTYGAETLSRDESNRLAALAKGNEEARDRLVKSTLPLVRLISNRIIFSGLNYTGDQITGLRKKYCPNGFDTKKI